MREKSRFLARGAFPAGIELCDGERGGNLNAEDPGPRPLEAGRHGWMYHGCEQGTDRFGAKLARELSGLAQPGLKLIRLPGQRRHVAGDRFRRRRHRHHRTRPRVTPEHVLHGTTRLTHVGRRHRAHRYLHRPELGKGEVVARRLQTRYGQAYGLRVLLDCLTHGVGDGVVGLGQIAEVGGGPLRELVGAVIFRRRLRQRQQPIAPLLLAFQREAKEVERRQGPRLQPIAFEDLGVAIACLGKPVVLPEQVGHAQAARDIVRIEAEGVAVSGEGCLDLVAAFVRDRHGDGRLKSRLKFVGGLGIFEGFIGQAEPAQHRHADGEKTAVAGMCLADTADEFGHALECGLAAAVRRVQRREALHQALMNQASRPMFNVPAASGRDSQSSAQSMYSTSGRTLMVCRIRSMASATRPRRARM